MRIGKIHDLQDFRAAEYAELYCFHGLSDHSPRAIHSFWQHPRPLDKLGPVDAPRGSLGLQDRPPTPDGGKEALAFDFHVRPGQSGEQTVPNGARDGRHIQDARRHCRISI
jgi:hypothetical protein